MGYPMLVFLWLEKTSVLDSGELRNLSRPYIEISCGCRKGISQMTKVKICGLRELDDALAAANAGAAFLGIVFEPHSRRFLEVENARSLVRSFRARWGKIEPRWVGVFANQTLEEVNGFLNYCDVDFAQLSGNESPAYCLQVVRPVVKTIHVKRDIHAEEEMEDVICSMMDYQDNGQMCMLDTFSEGALGGTGEVFNWEVAKGLARDYSFFLAGGLNSENVSEAVLQVRPWGVDVSSGVETDGRKDQDKIIQFMTQVKRTDEVLTSRTELHS